MMAPTTMMLLRLGLVRRISLGGRGNKQPKEEEGMGNGSERTKLQYYNTLYQYNNNNYNNLV